MDISPTLRPHFLETFEVVTGGDSDFARRLIQEMAAEKEEQVSRILMA